MQQLLLVNPRKRRAAGRRKPRSAAQKAATRRMLSANRSRRGPKRHSRSRSASYATNPAPRRRRARSLVARHTKRHTRRRRNPIGLGSFKLGSITSLLKSAALGAGGAIAVDVAYGYANSYLPDMVKSPMSVDGSPNYAYYAAKGAAAVGIGMLLKRVVGASKAGRMVEGSLTVTLHDLAKVIVASNMSSVKLGYAGAGRNAGTLPQAQRQLKGTGAYVSGVTPLGAYISGGSSGRNNAMRMRESVTH